MRAPAMTRCAFRWAVGALLVQLSTGLLPVVPLGIGAAKALGLAVAKQLWPTEQRELPQLMRRALMP